MKLVILDYFRRWGWVLALGITFQSIICWFTVSTAGTPFDFLFFPYAYFFGALPLFFDLRHGYTRAILALPVSIKQVARAWWLVAVVIPAIVLTLFGFLSAGISFLCHANGKFHLDWLAMNCVFNTLWLGASFFILTGLNTGAATNWWEQTRNTVFGALWGMLIGGGIIFCQNLAQNYFKFNLILIFGSIMSVAGWLRAEHLVLQRAGFRSASQSSGKRPAQYKISKGFNGIPLLVIMTLTRVLLIWLAMVFFMALLSLFEGQAASPEKILKSVVSVMTNAGPVWFIIIFQSLPILTHLRFLRTLPLSTMKLAIVLVTLPLLSALALAVILTTLAIPIEGAMKSFEMAGYFLMPATTITCFIPLAVWQGFNRRTVYLMFLALLGVMIPLQFFGNGKIPFSWSLPISGLVIIGAIWLTERLLASGSKAYRSWPNPLGGGWNWGR